MSDSRQEEEMAREREERERRFSVQKKVDTEWKRKVQREKEKLTSGAPAAPASPPPEGGPAPGPPRSPAGKPQPPEPAAKQATTDMGFMAVVQQLADQAALFLGLVPGYAEKNCEQALAAIEMLRSLQEKTKGNLSAQESKALTGVVYELQMRYVETCGAGGPGA